jgi:2,3,4,5-tetrahydropyridine-2-carboxylate N-succinyltransferase
MMDGSALKEVMHQAWQENWPKDKAMPYVHHLMEGLDQGLIRVAQKNEDRWIVHEWVKKGILLYFKFTESQLMQTQGNVYYDKVPNKFLNWDQDTFSKAQIRVVPGAFIRYGAFLDRNCVAMPSFINVGAYIGKRSMVDSGVTVGSCAQIGEGVHLSSNAIIGGVLEPLQSHPVIIEDNVFIGATACVLEGMIVEAGAVIAGGLVLTASTKIIDRKTQHVSYGRIPKNAVVVPGSFGRSDGPHLACAVIIKQIDPETRAKVSINTLLRDSD